MIDKADVLTEIALFKNIYDMDDKEQNKSIALNIYGQIDRFIDGTEPTAKEIAELTVAMSKEVQIRDLIMGMPLERDIQFVGSWAAFVAKATPMEYIAPIASVISSLYYSIGDKDEATRYLNIAYQSDPTYSLAKLLDRVYQSGWRPESVENMRMQLHPKVKEVLGI